MVAHQSFYFIRQTAEDTGGAVWVVLGNEPQQERPAGLLHLRDLRMPRQCAP